MSMVPSTASSRMRKRRSDNEYMHESQNDLWSMIEEILLNVFERPKLYIDPNYFSLIFDWKSQIEYNHKYAKKYHPDNNKNINLTYINQANIEGKCLSNLSSRIHFQPWS